MDSEESVRQDGTRPVLQPGHMIVYVDTGGTVCPKKSSKIIFERFTALIRERHLSDRIRVIERGCFGLCKIAPNAYIEPDEIWYSQFHLEDVDEIVEKHLIGGEPVLHLIEYPKRRVPRKKRGA